MTTASAISKIRICITIHLVASFIAFFAGFHEQLGFWRVGRALDFLLRSALFAAIVSGFVMPIVITVLARRGRTSLAGSVFYICVCLCHLFIYVTVLPASGVVAGGRWMGKGE